MSDLILDYMLMSGNAYDSTRIYDANKVPIPGGWSLLSDSGLQRRGPLQSGFEAAAYQQSNQIVISFAGTFPSGSPFPPDLVADGTLGYGACHDQLKDAALYYMQINAANPNADIVFTGHSLGGGLAALMGCLFGKQAFTFDQAPLRRAATEANRDALVTYLQGQGYSTDALFELTSFYSSRTELEIPGPNPVYVTNIRGEANVKDWHVKGEFLTESPNGTLSMDAWLLGVTRIGESTQIEQGASFNLPAFKIGNQISSVDDAHAIELAIALRASPTFARLTYDIPYFLSELFDKSLFASDTTSSAPNILTHLVRNGVAGDGMLNMFVADAARLCVRSYPMTNEKLGRGLLEVAMQYYWQATGQVAAPLFEDETGGFKFDMDKVAAGGNAIKGMAWLGPAVRGISGDNGLDPQTYQVWHVATSNVGCASLVGTGSASDIMIGGAFDDALEGGAGNDLLIGGSGNDTLDGRDGEGGDILEGGTGYDTYHADEGDTINDSDGKGVIYLNGKQLTFATRKKGETTWKDSTGNTYALNGGTLQINDPLTIEGFDNGEMGIYLDDEEDPTDPNGRPRPPGYNPNNASLVRRIDPLVLDLDGNGQIDAIGSSSSTIYFDFNGDGVSEKAGWIAPQDGLLALDANANGSIDGLDELFGSNQIDGFAELAGLDSNGDGKIDALDTDYTKLRVWQDANQDGISQSGELQTLQALGITSIDLATTPANTAIADNLVTATGSFTRNGESHLAADIHLAVNFALTDSNPNRPLGLPPQLDPPVFDLPWLRGYGNVKSLPVAYQESPALRQAASALADAGWLASLRNFDGFMTQWAGLTQAHAAHGVTRTTLTTEDKAWVLENLTGQDVQKSAIEAANFGAIAPGAGRLWNTAYIDTAWNSFVQREAMSFAVQAGTSGWLKGASYSLNQDRFIVTDAPALQASLLAHLNAVTDKEEAAFAAIAISRLKQDGAALDATVLKQGITTTTYQTLFDAVLDDGSGAIYGQQGNGGFAIDTGNGIVALGMGGNDYLYGGSGNDVIDGGAGNDTLHGGGGSDTYVFGTGAGQDTVDDYAVTADAGDRVRMSAEVMPGDVTVTRDQYHLYLNLNGGADRMSLQYWFSNNVYKHKSVTFADGTVWDATELERRIKPLPGTSGADNLFGGTADNTLDGGVGNDSLSGGTGDDTYVFGNGYGQDTVIEDPATDTTAFNQDTVQMLADVAPADVMVTRDQNNLYLNLNGGADRLTISNWFGGQANRIERVTFNDGTEWTAQDLVSRIVVQPGTPGADSIRGDETDNVIDGLAGNDQLFGNGGDDTLRGGVGNDALDGGNGNDVLDGGAGNDSLNGGAGDDSYVFGNGYGQDVINDYDWTAGNVDTVTMAEGIVPDDVVVTRDWGNLYLSLNNGADRLTLANWFGDAYKVERVAFADGTVWDAAELDARIAVTPASEGNDTVSGNAAGNLIEGLGGNDALYGYGGDDTLKGGSGNDYLLGDTGNDILDGGAGSDTLSGGVGNDTYVFGNGYGQDTVSEYDWTAGNIDTVALTDGVAPGDVTVTRDQYNLYLSLNNGADRLTLPNWFYGDGNRIEQVAFADGTVWSGADLVNRAAVVPGTEGKDFIAGASAGDAISGLGGDDQLYGNDGNDTLSGGSGNDFIDGGNGDDVLDGGAGHDALNGGDGSDSYVFGHGYGQDVVYEYDGNLANMDTVAMALGVVPEDVTVTRDQSHLYLSLNNGTDRLTLVNWFYGDAYRIDQVTFADGTVWGATELGSRVVIAPGTAGDDVILGDEASNAIDGLGGNDRIDGAGGADTLTGGAGNDRLDGGAGDDLIDGGSGTDVLVGGAGNDIYLFGPGSGQDSVIEADSTAGNVDTVRFVDTVSPVDVSVTRDWNNLFLSLNNGADRLTLQNWFYGDAYKVEGVVFGDGTEWSVAELASRVTVAPGTEGADYLSGNDSSVRLNWPPPAGKPTRGTVSRDSWVSTI